MFLLCGALLLGLAGGCSRLSEKRKANDQQQAQQLRAALDAVEIRIESEPHVQSVMLHYQDNISAPKTLKIEIQVQPGSVPSLDPVLDVAEREVWLSPIPLTHALIESWDAPGKLADDREIVVPRDNDRLVARYGSRPAPTGKVAK